MQESLCLHCRNPDVFAAQKLRGNAWVTVKLRITAFAIERLDASTGWAAHQQLLVIMTACHNTLGMIDLPA